MAKATSPEMAIKQEFPVEDFKKDRSRYKELTFVGKFSGDDDRKLLQRGIHNHLALMTQVSQRYNVWEICTAILKELDNARESSSGSFDVHDAYLDTLLKEIDDMKLFTNNFYVRQASASLVAELVYRKRDDQRQPYLPALQTLMSLLRDRKQIPAVKIHAVRGLTNYFHDATVSPGTRQEIVRLMLVDLSNDPPLEMPYQLRIIESLAEMGISEDNSRRPIVIQKLMQIIVNDEANPLLRAASARTIGRLPLETSQGSLNVELISIEIVRMALELASAWEVEPKKDFSTNYSFWSLYLAFKPANAEETRKGSGLLNQVKQKQRLQSYGPITKEAYELVVPVVNKVLFDSEKVDLAKHQEKMTKWLQEHRPRENRIAPTEEPLVTETADATK